VTTLAAGYVGSSIVGFLFIVSIYLSPQFGYHETQTISILISELPVVHPAQFASCKYLQPSGRREERELITHTHPVDIVASKIASFVIGIGLLVPAVRVDSFV
jgi:hypothetical protein